MTTLKNKKLVGLAIFDIYGAIMKKEYQQVIKLSNCPDKGAELFFNFKEKAIDQSRYIKKSLQTPHNRSIGQIYNDAQKL